MILCNRNREQVLEVTQQQLIIFPLIIARCAEATLRVLLCREHPRQGRCDQRRVIPSLKQKRRVRRRSVKLFVNTPLNRNVLKPTGTGSSRGPRPRGLGAQMFNSEAFVRVEHFYPVHVCFGVIKRFKRDNIASSDIMFAALLDRLRTRNVVLKDFCSCFVQYCAEGDGFTDLFGVLPTTFWAKKKFDYIADMPTCRRQRWAIPRGKKTTEQANACSVMFYA